MVNALFKKTAKLFTVKARKAKKRTILLIPVKQITKRIIITAAEKLA